MTQKQTLKKLTAGLITLALTLPLVPARAAKTTYQDVDDKVWYSAPVAFCQQHELMDGVSAGEFDPDGPMTRAALAEALYRLAGSPAPEGQEAGEADEETDQPAARKGDKAEEADKTADGTGDEVESPFPDVEADHPNLDAIRWARDSGVVAGYEDGTFGPEDPITREQLATLLFRYAQHIGRNTAGRDSLTGFSDGDTVSAWAQDAMAWTVDSGVLTGLPGDVLAPAVTTTRAQAAAMLQRFCRSGG